MQQSTALRVWIEGTIVAALAMILSFVPLQFGSSFSISLGMIPLTLYAFRRGWKAGLFAGFIWGLLHFPTGNTYFLSVPQVLIEYPIAFTFAGFAGLHATQIQQALREGNRSKGIRNIVFGVSAGVVARYFWHFVAGVIFWGDYAVGGLDPFWFSLIMNGISGLATGAVTLFVLLLISKKWPSLLLP